MSILDLNADVALAARPRFVEQPKPQLKTSIWQDAAALATAIPRGAGEGVAQVGATMAEIMAGYGDTMARMESGQSLQDRAPNMQSDFADSLRARGREFRPDAQSATAAEQVLFGFARGATKIVGGAVAGGAPGVVLAGVEEGYTQSGELIAEGVDPTTARKAGAVQGAGLALAALPVAGQTLRATAALYLAGGPGGFMAQQALTREILQRGGYDERAAATDPFDPVGLAVSALVPAPFAVMGLRSARLRADLTREIGAQAYTAPRAPDMTPTAQAVRAAFPREVEDAARVMVDVEQRARANPRPADDLPAAAAHETALARAEEQMARGEPVQVADVAPSDDAASFWASLPARALPEPSAVADELRGMGRGAYWAQVGGRIIRDPRTAIDPTAADAIFYGDVVGRTPWLPAEEWFGQMRSELGASGLSNQKQIQDAIEKAIAGEPLRAAEKRTIEWMRGEVQRMQDRLDILMPDPEDLAPRAFAEGLSGNDADDLAMTARAAEIDEAAVERAAVQFESDDAGFRAEMERIVRGNQEAAPAEAASGAGAATTQPRAGAGQGGSGARPPAQGQVDSAASPAASAEAATTQPALTLAEQQFPDLMVQMDGMDKPVPAAELLRVVREQAARDQQDGELLAAAAQCAIVNGF